MNHIPDGVHRGRMVGNGNTLKVGPESELTELDRDIIRHLQVDGRMSFVDLAATVNATQKTVRKRVAELRRSRLIEITTVADPHVIGYRSMALVGIQTELSYSRSDVARTLFGVPSVDYAVVTTGRFDLLVELLHRDDQELSEAIDREIRPHPGVRAVEIFPYLQLHYQQPVWESAQRKTDAAERAVRPADIDELDVRIMRELNEDGRAPFSHLANRLGVSESQIRKRYSKLTAANVLRVLALTNPRSLGFQVTAWLAISGAQGEGIRSLADKISALPSIAYLAVCSGQFDLFAEVVCRDKDDLLRIVDQEVRPMREVGHTESLLCQDLYYRPVIPPL